MQRLIHSVQHASEAYADSVGFFVVTVAVLFAVSTMMYAAASFQNALQ